MNRVALDLGFIQIYWYSICIVVGMQNIPGRSIDEPNYEVQENGSREGFVEILKTNMTLVRKRLVNLNFKIEVLEVGVSTKTKIALCYMDGKVDKKVLKEVSINDDNEYVRNVAKKRMKL